MKPFPGLRYTPAQAFCKAFQFSSSTPGFPGHRLVAAVRLGGPGARERFGSRSSLETRAWRVRTVVGINAPGRATPPRSTHAEPGRRADLDRRTCRTFGQFGHAVLRADACVAAGWRNRDLERRSRTALRVCSERSRRTAQS